MVNEEPRDLAAKLAESQQQMLKFQALVEASSDFIAIAGLDGQVSYVNPAGRRLIHVPDDLDVTGTTIADYLTEEGLQASIAIEQPAVVAHEHWEGTSTLRDFAGGEPIPVTIASFLMRHPQTGEPLALATVQRDIREHVATVEALRRVDEQRRALLARLVEAQEEERQRIAYDIHDDSIQAMAAVDLRLGTLRRELLTAAPDQVPMLDQLRAQVHDATERLRTLLFDLETPALDVPVQEALHDCASRVFAGDGPRIVVEGSVDHDVPKPIRAIAYRICQEALVNVRKHAKASLVTITVQGDGDWLEVSVDDDGVGLTDVDVSGRPGHLGLVSMRERAEAAGGACSVEAGPTGGTVVRFRLPFPTLG